MAEERDDDAAQLKIAALLRENQQLRESAARAEAGHRADLSDSDALRRLAALDAKQQATDVAREVVEQMIKSLGLDPDKPGEFVQDMLFLKELRETFGTVRRHAITVLVGIVILGLATGVWQMLKGAKS